MSKETQPSFWEDAYDQCRALAQSVDVLTALLEQNGQGELAHHIYTLFVAIPQSVAMRTPPAIRDRIAARIAQREEGDEVEEFSSIFEAMNKPVTEG